MMSSLLTSASRERVNSGWAPYRSTHPPSPLESYKLSRVLLFLGAAARVEVGCEDIIANRGRDSRLFAADRAPFLPFLTIIFLQTWRPNQSRLLLPRSPMATSSLDRKWIEHGIFMFVCLFRC